MQPVFGSEFNRVRSGQPDRDGHWHGGALPANSHYEAVNTVVFFSLPVSLEGITYLFIVLMLPVPWSGH